MLTQTIKAILMQIKIPLETNKETLRKDLTTKVLR
jgi:hypothetical protein